MVSFTDAVPQPPSESSGEKSSGSSGRKEALLGQTETQSRLTVRSQVMALIACMLVFAGYTTQSLWVSVLPYLLFVVGAAWLPQGPPPTTASAAVASALSIIQSSTYAALGLDRWRDSIQAAEVQEQPTGWCNLHRCVVGCGSANPHVHVLRAGISFVWAVGFLWLAADVLRWRCARFWTAVRHVVGICSLLRLAANIMLHALDAPPNCFVPGNLTLRDSVLFNLGCVGLAAFVLSARNRHWLSEWTGGARVVLKLAEVQEPEEWGGSSELLDDGRSRSSLSLNEQRSEVRPIGGMMGALGGEEAARPSSRSQKTQSARSAGSSAAPELGKLWGETPSAPDDANRAGSAVFYDSDDSGFDRRSPTREFIR